jgi:ketosteroid isomerase-like protein
MKFGLCLLSAILLSSWAATPSHTQEKPDAVSEVLALEAKWNDAYKQRDFVTLNSLLADDFVITVENGSTYSKSGYIAEASSGTTRVEISTMSDLKVRMHGNTAVVTGAYHEKSTTNGKLYDYHDRLTDIWVKIGGRWQLVASHYSLPVKG